MANSLTKKLKKLKSAVTKVAKSSIGKVGLTAIGLGAVVAVSSAVTKAQAKAKELKAIAKQVKVTKTLSLPGTPADEVTQSYTNTGIKITAYQKFIKGY